MIFQKWKVIRRRDRAKGDGLHPTLLASLCLPLSSWEVLEDTLPLLRRSCEDNVIHPTFTESD